MWPYFIIAAAASVLVWGATTLEKRVPDNRKKLVITAGYVLAGLLFCFFAGARDYSVGGDVHVYGAPAFDYSLETSFGEFFTDGRYAGWDPFSKILFWTGANATHSFFWYLFLLELFFVVPTFIGIRLLLKDAGYLGMLMFGILFFPMSLNLMRQAIAMGFVFLSYVFIRKRKPLLFVLLVAIGTLFHNTALIGLLLYPLYLIGSSDKPSQRTLLVKSLIMAAILLVVMIVGPMLLSLISPLLGHYGTYIRNPEQPTLGWLAMVVGTIVFCVALAVCYYLCLQKCNPEQPRSPELSGLAFIVFFGVTVNIMWLINAPLYRLGLYFMMFAILLIPMAINRLDYRPAKLTFTAVSILGSCAYAYAYYAIGLIHVVVPYVFA